MFVQDSDDAVLCQEVHESLNMSAKDIAAKPNHPFRPMLVFFLFARHLKNVTTNRHGSIDLWQQHVFFCDDVLEKRETFMRTSIGLRPKRPSFVYLYGYWHVWFEQRLCRFETVFHALSMWFLIMRARFKCTFEDERRVPTKLVNAFLFSN